VAAIRRVLDLGLGLEDFDAETGQTNGTLAHGLERVFSLCVNASGFRHGGHWSPADEIQINWQPEFV
jgi:lipopolysaccharide biosynthesis protein